MSDGIHKAMVAILSDFDPVAKDAKNVQSRFAARSIDQVMDALHPLLTKHKVYMTMEVRDLQRAEYTTSKGNAMQVSIATVAYHFTHADGSTVTSVCVGEGSDTGDKSTSKALAMAMKYCVLQGFCVAVGDADPDTQTPEPRAAGTRRTQARTGSGSDGKISDPQRRLLWARSMDRAKALLPDGEMQHVKGQAEQILRTICEHQGVTSSTDLQRRAMDGVLEAIDRFEPGGAAEPEGTADPKGAF